MWSRIMRGYPSRDIAVSDRQGTSGYSYDDYYTTRTVRGSGRFWRQVPYWWLPKSQILRFWVGGGGGGGGGPRGLKNSLSFENRYFRVFSSQIRTKYLKSPMFWILKACTVLVQYEYSTSTCLSNLNTFDASSTAMLLGLGIYSSPQK